MCRNRRVPNHLRRLLRGIRNIALFFATLFAVGALQSRSITVSDGGTLSQKWQHLCEHGEQYSLIFIGSSRVANHFIPEQFDTAMRQAGLDVKSFNFGQGGMYPPESLYVLRKLLEHTPAKPRWVLIDITQFTIGTKGSEDSEREIRWHDFHHTCLTLRYLWSAPPIGNKSGNTRLDSTTYHLKQFAERTLGVGRFQESLRSRLELLKAKKPVVFKDGGFVALEPRALSAEQAEMFSSGLAMLNAPIAQTVMREPYRTELIELAALVRKHGAIPVFVDAPFNSPTRRFRDWPPDGETQFSYSNPATCPTLFRLDQRYDASHLDGNGAKEFTRIFAAEFAKWVTRS